MRRYRFATSAPLLGLFLFAACESDDVSFQAVPAEEEASSLDSYSARREFPPGSPAAATGADAGAADTDNGSAGMRSALPGSISVNAEGKLLCGSSLCACNNGVDDDGDGTIDGFDVECTGGLDDDEGTFATGIPGDNRDPKWQDCFFDGNSGHGDDGCRYPTGCLTGELAEDDAACAVTEQCRKNCLPLAPNGCDCFGCCSVGLPGGGSVDVRLDASCSLEKIGDAEACAPCAKSAECANTCDRCELCDGKTAADLPLDCNPPPGTEAPPATDPPAAEPPAAEPPSVDEDACDGQGACSAEQPCPAGQFCAQGCCIAQVGVIR
ncbi:MAG: hypothetical protein RL685_698 [Pseudomonadota bacterium]